MKTFIVNVKEIWVQPVEIVAENRGDAIKKVAAGEGTPLNEAFEYSHTADPEEWNVDGEFIKPEKKK